MENELQALLDEFIELEEGLDRLRAIFKKIIVRLQNALGVPVEATTSSVSTGEAANVDLNPIYDELHKLAVAIKTVDDKVNGLIKGGIKPAGTQAELSPALKNEILLAVDIIKKWSKEMEQLKHETGELLAKVKQVTEQ